MSVTEKSNGKILVRCFGDGCSAEDIVAKLGLQMSDLFVGADCATKSNRKQKSNGRTSGESKRKTDDGLTIHRTPKDAVTAMWWWMEQSEFKGNVPKLLNVQGWSYHNAKGDVVGGTWRYNYETTDGIKDKTYRLMSRVENGWINRGPKPRLLYRLHLLVGAEEIWLHEGEKATDAAVSVGLNATTTMGGCSQVKETDFSPVNGVSRVVLCPDSGREGEKWTADCIRQLKALENPPEEILVCDLGFEESNLDLADWLEGIAADDNESIQASLRALCSPIEIDSDAGDLIDDGDDDPEFQAALKSLGSCKEQSQTDVANAERFVHLHGDNVRYVGTWDKWICFDGKRWRLDADRRVEKLAKDVSAQLFAELEIASDKSDFGFAKRTASAPGISALLALARSEVPIDHSVLNQDPWLLNVSNGIVDLRTGELQPHAASLWITQTSPVKFDADSACPRWEKFVHEIMNGDKALAAYLQRLTGYAMTGVIREHVLPILHGTGANGKSTLINVVLELLGRDYAMKAPHNLLMVKKHDGHPTEQAAMFGRRLIAAVETGDSQRINEPLVKELTGGDPITARRMREDFWQFDPTHKLWMATNHRPVVRGTDEGIWRRLRLVPFDVSIPPAEQDRNLTLKLMDELSGILNWAIEGCLSWQKVGLDDPPQVSVATTHYRDDSDPLEKFLTETTVHDSESSVQAARLYEEYTNWGGSMSNTAFGRELSKRGFEKRRRATGYFYFGLRITTTGDH